MKYLNLERMETVLKLINYSPGISLSSATLWLIIDFYELFIAPIAVIEPNTKTHSAKEKLLKEIVFTLKP